MKMGALNPLSILLIVLIGISFVNGLSFYVGTSGADGSAGFSDAEYMRLRAVCKNYINSAQKRSGPASPQIAQICKNVMKRSEQPQKRSKSPLDSLFDRMYNEY
ncbi:hypothetical protein PRIPAC_77904 [Pristionchus pacificus]|uniref:Uncharacterized protein n=1 Tax=Pristionchus pacificus TaxID=54126 RepID=A0A2A6BED0_PRIPA|nr:hypothetical protein PRIPAC_77904 [Pristionchus pacificus]|eukprot:PDM64260.1 hypothetical protein PRIPAC_54504 [Pristionchus pacificus]